MSTAIINIKTNAKVKAEAQKIAAEFGLSLSGILNAYLRDLIRNKEINFKLPKEEEPTQYMLDSLREAQEEFEKGDCYSFDNHQDAINFLNKI